MKEPVSIRRKWLNTSGGLALILGCYVIGGWLKQVTHVRIPGNVLGLFLLLALLGLKVVKVSWVESASTFLITGLPIMFLPVYVLALSHRELWPEPGRILLSVVPAGVVVMWAVVGMAAQFLFLKVEPKRGTQG